jgi:2,3-bisphosphoglycerate-dependent phosphoglycerate mutase
MPMLPEYFESELFTGSKSSVSIQWISSLPRDTLREACRPYLQTEVSKMSSRLYKVGYALLLLSAVILLAPPGVGALGHEAGQEGVTTVFLVRHAEKDTIPEGNPQLSEAGEVRAQVLAHVLEEAGVTAIFASQFRRTQDTVRPLADLLGLEVEVVYANRSDELADTIRQNHRGGVVVVSGHSNTVPEIIVALGAGPVAPIEEGNEYDNLYVVSLSEGGAAEVTTLKFGRRPQ